MDWEIIDSLSVACMENNLAAFRACPASYMRALRDKERAAGAAAIQLIIAGFDDAHSVHFNA
jgi:hypothetical protein